ncbi:hypothetical protein [Pilimelia columellifera]|uniref:Uncharacterized protein n=1 Tax=Pilimelia columellifera subsp. columellifera TaxID=706583 RepID=A0ABP6A681_9ACTN
MIVSDRLIRILHVDGHGLLAADVYGRIHLLDDGLRVVRSSPFVRHGRPVYGLAVADGWVIGKDRGGAILRWRLDTLELADRLDPAAAVDRALLLPREEPAPASSRGIGVWDGRVFVSSGYHRHMLVLDLHTFEVLQVRPNPTGDSPMEWACTEHPSVHAVSDKKGNLRFGSFATMEFGPAVKLDEGNIHRVRYDARHDRFWATQDFGAGADADIANGVLVLDADGTVEDRLLFARDDVEFVVFAPDQRRAYAGGFDGELHVLDNSDRQLRLHRTVTGFSHQLIDCAVAADGSLYVLCQDGEVTRLDSDGELTATMGFPRQAVWDIQADRADPATVYCATDTGVATVAIGIDARGPLPVVAAEHRTGLGFTRRVAALAGGVVGISRDRHAFRMNSDGAVLWQTPLPALPHTVAVDSDGRRALVATNGGAVELNTADGARLALLDVGGLPVWAGLYLPSGERLLITRNGVIVVVDSDGVERWRFDQGDYPKRAWLQDGLLYVVGDGGLKEIAIGGGVRCRWSRLMSNTVENAVVTGDLVVASSYGMQLGVYDYRSAKLLALVEDLPDYPKALAVARDGGRRYLLVGCRGGLLSTYHIDRAAPGGPLTKLRDHWLARTPAHIALQELPFTLKEPACA